MRSSSKQCLCTFCFNLCLQNNVWRTNWRGYSYAVSPVRITTPTHLQFTDTVLGRQVCIFSYRCPWPAYTGYCFIFPIFPG